MYLQVFAFWSSKDSTCPCKRVGPPRIASEVPGANELESMSLEPVFAVVDLSANSESQPDEDRDWNVAYSKLTVRITLTPVRSEGFGIPDSQNFEVRQSTVHGPPATS
ncbi:hypothetical protein PGTUg99_019043 [Puccinia graminis f. sp. tritici]|uniref:Uncharacterized protein n=1 Tax=Puccinia graminis f. sp. tritici TaxID=56615 RepID=A0A5B0NQV9_PUCGR|nr:hypothetical protein PGTUg99_001986 [Puccinia graminis f. sp. tritici]KAA1098797.1 hypothetical protein PGTUg99_019043 [Puccinia graminis f. sp. tritici]